MSSKKAISNSFSISTIEDGRSAATLELSRSTILYDAYNSGASTQAQSFPLTFALYVEGNVCSVASANNVSISVPTNVSVRNKTTSSCTLSIGAGKSVSGVVRIMVTGTLNGISYSAGATITIEANKQGADGKSGRFYYYAGEFDKDDDRPIEVSETQAPYFEYTDPTTDRKSYWVFLPEESGTYTMNEMGVPSSSNPNWHLMTDDFKYLITEAIFGEFAKFGSAIISGDWMLSTNGTKNGAASTSYTDFDPNYPNADNNGTNFIPNYCVNLLTGATYQQNAYVEGSIYTDSVRTKFVSLPSNCSKVYIGLPQALVSEYDANSTSVKVGYTDAWNLKVPSDIFTQFILIMNKEIVVHHKFAESSQDYDEVIYNNNFQHGQRLLLYNTKLNVAGGTADVSSIVAAKVELYYDHDENYKYIDSSTYTYPLRGVAKEKNEPEYGMIFDYVPAYGILFVDGIVETMCVPGGNSTDECDWCVIEIGTNVYKLF